MRGTVQEQVPLTTAATTGMTTDELMAAIDNVQQAVQHLSMVAKNLEARVKELESREAQYQQEKSNAGTTVNNASTSSTDWWMPIIATPPADVLYLNVGGQKFTTSKATLLRTKGSYFEDILIKNPQSIEFFIDHDPQYFGIVLNYIRDGKLRNGDLKTVDLDDLREEFKFFKIPVPPTLKQTKERTPEVIPEGELSQRATLFEGGTLLAPAHKHKITEWLPNKKFTLMYKATVDGFSADAFHAKCDDKGPTLAVIQSKEGHLFGGYTAQSWGGNGFKTDQTTFLYTLTNPHSIPPTKYVLKPLEANHAIMCYNFYTVVYGGGVHALQVCSLSNEVNNSWVNFPGSFIDSTGKGKDTFTGGSSFTSTEIEIYSVA